MTVDDLLPYLGTRCSIRLRCRGCGGTHLFIGTPEAGKHLGDVRLDGYTFSVEDIEQIWNHGRPGGRRFLRGGPGLHRSLGSLSR